ncbi:MAG: hypothetical protein QOF54_462 [Solirubrobacteraceae bacterium]|jgi:hypothetical protein|nr:hypothetical protein [Solirubrobacteraceae bacterium]
MARGPATPPAGEPPRRGLGDARRAPEEPPQTPGAAGEPPLGDERYGPLAVLRTHKDDGRALILYSDERREPPDEANDDSEPTEPRA